MLSPYSVLATSLPFCLTSLLGEHPAPALGMLPLVALDRAEGYCLFPLPGYGSQFTTPDEVVDELARDVEDDPRLCGAQKATGAHATAVGMPVDNPLDGDALVRAGRV